MANNILVVDELGMAKAELEVILKELDISITGVDNEEEASKEIKEGKKSYSAVIWTLNSTDTKGFEAIKRMRKMEAAAKIPFAVVSGFTGKKYIVNAIEAGASDFFAKPYDNEMIVKKVCRLLGITQEKPFSRIIEDDFIILNFNEVLNRDMKAASRGSYPLSLVMCCMSYGDSSQEEPYRAINELIDSVVKVLRLKLRETDSVFKYGERSLIVILPFTEEAGAGIVMEKIEMICSTNTIIKQKSKGYALRCKSVTYPDDGKIKAKLLEELEKKFLDSNS